MVIRFFASNPKFYYKQVGSPKSEVRCAGHFSFLAILTSERADIQDPEVKQLANGIIKAQRAEIEEMKTMIKRLEDQ